MNELLKYAYQGSEVTFSNGENVMVNATQMAKAFGKEVKHWSENDSTTEFILSLARARGIEPNPHFANLLNISEVGKFTSLSISDLAKLFPSLIKVVRGGLEEQGTWMHEDVALVFAQWLSPEFYLWCNDRIKELIKNGVSDIRETPQDYLSALKALVAKEEERLRLEADNKILKPKADYFDDLVDRNLLTNFRDFSKELNVGQKYLIEWLMSNRYIYRNEKGKIKPYSKYSEGDSRLFEVKEYKATNNSHSGTQTLITPRGRETFRLLIPRQQDLDI